MRHTVVISDIHLSEVERGGGLWMRYRQRPFLPDGELSAMLAALRERVRGEELTLVLNGDIFDLDAPRVIGEQSVFHDLPRTPEHTVPALAAILDDHPVFLAALGHVLADGHRVVVIAGNHDIGLALPEARELIAERLVEAARLAEEARGAPAKAGAPVHERITFRAWFFKTPDGILIEHGHQYDRFCSYRYPMTPFAERPREIPPTMGSLGTRLLIARLGYFNPHDERSLARSTLGYALHWARYYLLSRRSIALTWLAGTLHVFVTLARRREPSCRARRRKDLAAAARETGAPLLALARHARLFARPIGDRLAEVARELWVDRVAVAAASLFFCALCAILFGRSYAWLGLSTPLFVIAYGFAAPQSTVRASYLNVGRVMREIRRIHRACAVVFGHSHVPDGTWEDDRFAGNPGSWSAITDRDHEAGYERHVVWLKSNAEALCGGLYEWKNGSFEPRTAREIEEGPREAPVLSTLTSPKREEGPRAADGHAACTPVQTAEA